MKKKRIAMALALVLGIGIVGGANTTAYANNQTIEQALPNLDDVDPYVSSENGVGTADFDTTVNFSGRTSNVVYNISVVAGTLVFNYHYGSSWDPTSHSYSGDTSVGWKDTDYTDTNNRISFANNSNYPVTVEASYSHAMSGDNTIFNDAYASASTGTAARAKMVNGYFRDTNNPVSDWQALGTTIAGVDASGSSVPAAITSAMTWGATLDTNTVTFVKGSGPCWCLTTPGGVSSTDDVYFGYLGTPDIGKTGTGLKGGTIHIVIKPVDKSLIKDANI